MMVQLRYREQSNFLVPKSEEKFGHRFINMFWFCIINKNVQMEKKPL